MKYKESESELLSVLKSGIEIAKINVECEITELGLNVTNKSDRHGFNFCTIKNLFEVMDKIEGLYENVDFYGSTDVNRMIVYATIVKSESDE